MEIVTKGGRVLRTVNWKFAGADLSIWMRERAEQGMRRTVSRTAALEHMILKLVNPLESLEDRIAIHIWIDFYTP